MSEPEKRAHVVLGGTASGTSAASAGTVRTKTNFSILHLLAAARFARMSADVEAVGVGDDRGERFEEVIAYVTATVLAATAGLEAYINELFIDHKIFDPGTYDDTVKHLWTAFWKATERKNNFLEKYKIALDFRNQEWSAKDGQIRQSAELLYDVRNELVHFKTQWNDEEKSHHQVAARLKKVGIQISPFHSTAPGTDTEFPNAYMSHDMAKWVVRTSWQFLETFSERAGLANQLSPFVDRLNPRCPSWP